MLPKDSERPTLEKDAWSGRLSIKKAGGQQDIRMFMKGVA
jgi:hypothetical protein